MAGRERRKKKQLSYRTLLSLGGLAFVLVVLVTGTVSLYGLRFLNQATGEMGSHMAGIERSLRTITERQEPLIRGLAAMRRHILEAQLNLYMAIAGYKETIKDVWPHVEALETRSDDLVAMSLDEEVQEQVGQIKQRTVQYRSILQRLENLSSLNQEEIDELGTQALAIGTRINDLSRALQETAQQAMQAVARASMAAALTSIKVAESLPEQGRRIGAINMGVVLVGVALSLSLAFFVVRRIANPLRRMAAAASKIAEGDLNQHIDYQAGDEIGVLVTSFNRMAEHLADLINQVQQAGIQVTSSTTQLAASGKQLESMMTEQVASTTQVVTTTREIAATSQELARTMQDVTLLSDDTATAAASSHAGLGQMATTMRQMEGATRTIAEKLDAIQERADDITTVVTTITKVADQTNLLSLNAAIEAEKAGEYGRGFAVVAREIRRLADQTAVATLEIERIVNEMRAAVAAGVVGMDQFAHEVQQGVQHVREVGEQLGQIVDRVQALKPRFDTVNQGMQAQAEGAQQISEAMAQLNDAAQQTAESLHASTRAIEQLNTAVQGLHDEITRFNGQA